MINQQDLAIYIHYPFCQSKCPYCDFNSHVASNINYDLFLQAYKKELKFFAQKINKKISSIFFGGGTPSLMPINLVAGILEQIKELWQLKEDCEINLEANPTSVEAEKFSQLANIGINRLSLGIQALNLDDLKFLGRTHCVNQAIDAINLARKYFHNFSFDLIYARPNQTAKQWQEELKLALSFDSKHLSLYQLTIEKGTPFFTLFQQKQFTLPSEERACELYQITSDICLQHSFHLYEISNYAKQNFTCKHNLAYWQGLDYIGIGAGAHSRFSQNNKTFATANFCQPQKWLQTLENNQIPWQTNEELNSKKRLEELLLMGLRLSCGIEKTSLEHIYQKNFQQIFATSTLQKLLQQELIIINDKYLSINPQHRLLTNQIITKLCLAIL
jgi:putative oxygen-independent coproporphyrinogen III oxidase